jgi:adenine-specific DNA-methyltransferase
MAKSPKETKKTVVTLKHDEASRKNIPTAEHQSVMQQEEQRPIPVHYERGVSGLEDEKNRRNRDLDPQLVWRGKDEKDWSDLVVQAPPFYIQEKVQPKFLIDDLLRRAQKDQKAAEDQFNLFADFNGLPSEEARTEFYQHDANWSNRMILGDSLQVMASLAEREGLRGKVQCIYIDPPYGIKFNSNFQWSTTSRDVKDGSATHITREPEQVKAFRDTWRDGIHSYFTYLRDRLTVARDLLSDSGSIFVQIGDENVHRLRILMDEVFGDSHCIAVVAFKKTGAFDTNYLQSNFDHIIWYAKTVGGMKFRPTPLVKTFSDQDLTFFDTLETGPFTRRPISAFDAETPEELLSSGRPIARNPLNSDGWVESLGYSISHEGYEYEVPRNRHWTTTRSGIERLGRAGRLLRKGNTLRFVRYWDDYTTQKLNNFWVDTGGGGFVGDTRTYVVQTDTKVIQRCILMCTDPGDLVLDPTCGAGSSVFTAEQWGRRWITIDTSRVALALARARIMGARYPYYLLADTRDGQIREAEVTRREPSSTPTRGDIRHGFVYERVPHITLKSIANNAEIDVIWEKFQQTLEPLRTQLNHSLDQSWEEWQIPREAGDKWSAEAKDLHRQWWQQRIARQKEIDASIAAKAEYEYLYDKPYEDNKKVRVAGPFTVESLSPHRALTVGENDELIEDRNSGIDFVQVILENLKSSGVQQAHKQDKIVFSSLTPWPGDLVCAEGRYLEAGKEKRAAILIGPEFGTVSRPDLVAAAREAGDAQFDVLITCAFNYDAHSSEFTKLGRIPVLKARMNADLHMAGDLKNTGKGNLFVIFGEPDITIVPVAGGQVQVKINGVDVFDPNSGEVRSDSADGIACWFIDTDYNEESFFVRHAYFLGQNDPYKSLKTTLKAEINEEAWATLHSDLSRPFDKPKSGRIAVKVINHLGDEVMKVFRVGSDKSAHP